MRIYFLYELVGRYTKNVSSGKHDRICLFLKKEILISSIEVSTDGLFSFFFFTFSSFLGLKKNFPVVLEQLFLNGVLF